MTKRAAHVAVGPITTNASWKWLGPHLAESLAGSYTVRFFSDGDLPLCDAAIFVKQRPAKPLAQAIDRQCRIIYLPADYYDSRSQIEFDSEFLRHCVSLLVHSKYLGRLLTPYNPAVTHVDHPNLYGLADKVPYRSAGILLWIGDFYNLPYLLRWRVSVELAHELKILTNSHRISMAGTALTLARARRLGVEIDVAPGKVNGFSIYEWSPARQRDMMAAAKAALDIKGGQEHFNQFTKPPTKAQQFIVSGIPFAINANSGVAAELWESGIEVAEVGDQGQWFSHEYWKSTRKFSELVERRIHPGVVAANYRSCLEASLRRKPPAAMRAGTDAMSGPRHKASGGAALWHDFIRVAHLLHRLGVPWHRRVPHTVTRVLKKLRNAVPGCVACSEHGAGIGIPAAVVSVVVDFASPDERESTDAAGADQAPGNISNIPAGWEIIAPHPVGPADRIDVPFRILRRWPRRGLLSDRMLASRYASGDYLAFVSSTDRDVITWIGQGLSTLGSRPLTGMIVRPRAMGEVPDGGASYIIRNRIWRALRGYQPGAITLSSRCGEIDLQQRVRLLGYGIESATVAAAESGEAVVPAGGITLAWPDNNVVVYTAITNCCDRLLSLEKSCAYPSRQVAFLDGRTRGAQELPARWEIRDIERNEPDKIRQAKIYKIRPELYFPNVGYSLWIVGNVLLTGPFGIDRMIELFLTDADLCAFRHHARSCIYQEAAACILRRLDDPGIIDGQMARYRGEAFPERYGLNEGVVILRRHSRAIVEFDRLWWQEIERGSRRDQLSFNYVQWKTGLTFSEFPLSILEQNGLFAKRPHAREQLRWRPRRAWREMSGRTEGLYFGAPPGARRGS